MLTLREILFKTIERSSQVLHNILPEVQVSKIAKEIESRYSRAENSPAPADLQEISNVFLLAEKDNSWQKISERIWKKACWILWSGSDPMAANKIFMNKYLEFCSLHASSRILKSLIHVYLRDFKKGMEGQAEVARYLREKINTDRFKTLLSLWIERDKEHFLFDVRKDFGINAKKYINSPANARDFLLSIGLEGALEASNYSQCLFEAVACEVESSISTTRSSINLLNKLTDISLLNADELRYPQKKHVLIESLLRPWQGKTPPSELCKKTLEFLLKHFNDPRTVNGRSNWVGVKDEVLRVIYKWLAGETLEQFFEIIKKTANDEHWSYRHKFWKAYFDDGHIDNAWVALGRDSQSEAKFHSTEGNELFAASVKGNGVKADHSVLIFKVGDLTICEWSHDGKCRVWFENNKNSPRLYESSYEADQLRAQSQKIVDGHKGDGMSHINSKSYWWQKRLADFIEYHTGIKMPSRKYEVR